MSYSLYQKALFCTRDGLIGPAYDKVYKFDGCEYTSKCITDYIRPYVDSFYSCHYSSVKHITMYYGRNGK